MNVLIQTSRHCETAKAVSSVLATLILFSGCVSGAKRLAQLDLATTNPIELESLCVQGLSGACALQGKSVSLDRELSIMQGVSSPTQSRFVVLTPKKERLVYYARSNKGISRLQSERFERSSSPMAVDQVEAFSLDVKENYELIVINSQAMVLDRRQFRALDVNKKRPRLAVISCMDDSMKIEQAAMWRQLINESPDAIFMIGDNVYADRVPGGWKVATTEQLWDRYVDTRSTLALFKSPVLIPVFATWDDHDYGRNDSDRTYELKSESAQAFHAFFAQTKPAYSFVRGPGVSSWWGAYGVQFALLDNRTFRSPNHMDLPDQTHFGSEQEDWLATQLETSKQPVLLISGDQFFGGYHTFESYQGSHPKSFTVQLARWKKSKAPILFVSGDRHLTEIIQVPRQVLGYPTFELTSSPLHAKVFAEAFTKQPSPQQLVGAAGQYNYMLLELVKSSPKLLQVNVRSVGRDNKILFQKSLTVKK